MKVFIAISGLSSLPLISKVNEVIANLATAFAANFEFHVTLISIGNKTTVVYDRFYDFEEKECKAALDRVKFEGEAQWESLGAFFFSSSDIQEGHCFIFTADDHDCREDLEIPVPYTFFVFDKTNVLPRLGDNRFDSVDRLIETCRIWLPAMDSVSLITAIGRVNCHTQPRMSYRKIEKKVCSLSRLPVFTMPDVTRQKFKLVDVFSAENSFKSLGCSYNLIPITENDRQMASTVYRALLGTRTDKVDRCKAALIQRQNEWFLLRAVDRYSAGTERFQLTLHYVSPETMEFIKRGKRPSDVPLKYHTHISFANRESIDEVFIKFDRLFRRGNNTENRAVQIENLKKGLYTTIFAGAIFTPAETAKVFREIIAFRMAEAPEPVKPLLEQLLKALNDPNGLANALDILQEQEKKSAG